MSDLEPVSYRSSAVESVSLLRAAIIDMMDSARQMAEAGDWESLMTGLAPLQSILADMRMLENQVKQHILETMPSKRVSVSGVGTAERMKRVTRKNWDSEELLRFVVLGALVDQETGEIPADPVVAVDRVLSEVRACVPFTGSTSWRVGALKDRGIDPDEWCDQNLEDYSLKFTRNKSEDY